MTETKLKSKLDYYDIVRENLATGPLHYPKNEKIFELMKLFWDEEQIKLLAHFPPVGEKIHISELAEKSGLSKGEIKKLLQPAVQKRTLIKQGRKYELAPLVPGIFEAYYIVRTDSKENQKKAAEIYRYIFKHTDNISIIEKDFGLFRPLLPTDTKERLLKIDESIENKSQVLPYELVEDLINQNESWAYITCQCRLVGELTDEPCEIAPAEMGCFITGPRAEALTKIGIGKGLTKKRSS